MDQIGCPPRGDCYVLGSEILLDWDILIMGSAIFIRPICCWFILIAPAMAIRARLRSNNTFKPSPLRGSA